MSAAGTASRAAGGAARKVKVLGWSQRLGATEKPRPPPQLVADEFSPAAETRSLVNDFLKSAVHQTAADHTATIFGPRRDPRRDSFRDVLHECLREEAMRLNRPVLTNDPATYSEPFMSRRASLRNLLLKRVVKTAGEENLIPAILDRDPVQVAQRSQAAAPPDYLEPLVAFAGLTHFSVDRSARLAQKCGAVATAVAAIVALGRRRPALPPPDAGAPAAPPPAGAAAARALAEKVKSVLPENLVHRSDELDPLHPFRNKFSFETAVPDEILGSVRQGQPRRPAAELLRAVRYPTLQSAAHGLPADRGYREATVHAIRRLEYTRGWSPAQKEQFINRLKEVANNLASSGLYRQLLDRALPRTRARSMASGVHTPRKGLDGAQRYLAPLRSIGTRRAVANERRKKH